MQKVQHYTMNRDLNTVEHGPISLEEALAVAERYRQNLQPAYTWGEDAIAESTFGFMLEDATFLEISFDDLNTSRLRLGPVEYLKKGFLSNKYVTAELEITLDCYSDLVEAITAFFTREKSEFLTYFNTFKPRIF